MINLNLTEEQFAHLLDCVKRQMSWEDEDGNCVTSNNGVRITGGLRCYRELYEIMMEAKKND
tara:strand:- start:194 stop:379 length:186 start_codon:yes stop_codon:yes gene_type:complete